MTASDYQPLVDGEVEIEPADDGSEELLFRQMTDLIWDSDSRTPVSHAFGPKNIDAGAPSFTRSAVVNAQESRDWHNANASRASLAVWACSIQDVVKTGTRAIDDSKAPLQEGKTRAPGHAYVDFRHLNRTSEKYVRHQLLQAALKRGEQNTTP